MEYSVSVPVLQAGRQITFGFLLAGKGKGWVDDLELLVDAQPVALATARTPTILDSDHEFDGGSGIHVSRLSNVQVKNLATLAKVWGFLKYHHPALTGGLRHWDYDLFRILPRVLDAADGAAVNAAITRWIEGLGAVEECTDCASLG